MRTLLGHSYDSGCGSGAPSNWKRHGQLVFPDGPIQARVRSVSLTDHQIADEPGFPAPVERDGRGRLWSRREVQAWAKRWRREKPWR